jgi:hypothetical protein
MEYKGRYKVFDTSRINTYPLKTRTNKVKLEDLMSPEIARGSNFDVSEHTAQLINTVAEAIVKCRNNNQPVIVFTGAHLIKNGLGRLLADLVNRNMITLLAGNGATAIHDFELALIGQTSEYVPQALEKGQFGMAYEFAFINTALALANKYKLGYGESLGKMICDKTFRAEVLAVLKTANSPSQFSHPQVSVLAACYEKKIPFTVHAGIGTDVIDQHPSFDGESKGGCSGRDFLIYVNEVSKMTTGGIFLNIGSAVTGPEVLLKAVSMAANTGFVPEGIIAADFDLRAHMSGEMTNESSQYYYFRDQKSVVTRVPEAFGGRGYYVQGNQRQTIPVLYKKIVEQL